MLFFASLYDDDLRDNKLHLLLKTSIGSDRFNDVLICVIAGLELTWEYAWREHIIVVIKGVNLGLGVISIIDRVKSGGAKDNR